MRPRVLRMPRSPRRRLWRHCAGFPRSSGSHYPALLREPENRRNRRTPRPLNGNRQVEAALCHRGIAKTAASRVEPFRRRRHRTDTENMNCRRFQDRLDQFVEGTLSAGARAAADQHLAGCAACREIVGRELDLARFLSAVFDRAPNTLRFTLGNPAPHPDGSSAQVRSARARRIDRGVVEPFRRPDGRSAIRSADRRVRVDPALPPRAWPGCGSGPHLRP